MLHFGSSDRRFEGFFGNLLQIQKKGSRKTDSNLSVLFTRSLIGLKFESFLGVSIVPVWHHLQIHLAVHGLAADVAVQYLEIDFVHPDCVHLDHVVVHYKETDFVRPEFFHPVQLDYIRLNMILT